MPKLTVDGLGQFEVPQGKRLVLALEQDAGVDQLHACGGNARCTTCRVEFVQGEPDRMSVAERDVLKARGLPLGRQEAARYVASCLSSRIERQEPDHRLLARHFAAL